MMSTQLSQIAKKAGSEGAVYLVGTLIDAGIPHGNMGNDEPARSQWD
jgi:hypothetical protein